MVYYAHEDESFSAQLAFIKRYMHGYSSHNNINKSVITCVISMSDRTNVAF